MNDLSLALLGTFLLGIGMPISTGWIEVGHVNVHDQGERFMRDFPMRAPVERLRLKAGGNDVFCRSVQATFASGNSLELFQGLLQRDRPTDVELPGNGLGLQSLTFQCGALVRGSAQIDVIGDPGRYRNQWSSKTNS